MTVALKLTLFLSYVILLKFSLKLSGLKAYIPTCFQDAVCSPMRLLCVGLMPVAASPLTALRMCPRRISEDDPSYQPLLALGTAGGVVQIINIATTTVHRELAVHTHPVR